ncbi:hypothetical protein KSC_070970 [Ktedonobacter sp. SOSP1-52]|uniref:hypothetical protein n=1 Tax=Ktedonobacter sp. SOSP1-52 TaxID=2778366 RepID=UPI001915259A|nr:hypothetical protein [Ktedonobacter sp. SOSP1-52]GHO68205.1 hypothetical protein KSC_070970 [Ktedonobacter sp. SOSP1-52]
MSIFDQRGQHVHTQYNAQHMNFGTVQNMVDFTTELIKLREEIGRVKKEGLLDRKQANAVDYHITEVVEEAEETQPDKKTMLDHLNTAKSLISGVTAASGLVTALVGAIEAVQKLF